MRIYCRKKLVVTSDNSNDTHVREEDRNHNTESKIKKKNKRKNKQNIYENPKPK